MCVCLRVCVPAIVRACVCPCVFACACLRSLAQRRVLQQCADARMHWRAQFWGNKDPQNKVTNEFATPVLARFAYGSEASAGEGGGGRVGCKLVCW